MTREGTEKVREALKVILNQCTNAHSCENCPVCECCIGDAGFFEVSLASVTRKQVGKMTREGVENIREALKVISEQCKATLSCENCPLEDCCEDLFECVPEH